MLSDCECCWETPCQCGFGYIGRSAVYVQELRDALILAERFKREHPEVTESTPYKERREKWNAFRKRTAAEVRGEGDGV